MEDRITIIGGGATGTLLAVNLIERSGRHPLTVNIIEKNHRLGRGIAYSTAADYHLLNVPAAKMSAFPHAPDHFFRWLTEKRGFDFLPSDFVPRRIYGEYLSDVLETALARRPPSTTVNFFDAEAVDAEIEDDALRVKLASGEAIESDKLVLAFGNFLPPHPNLVNQEFTAADNYSQNPWAESFFDNLPATADVLILGTGLTMVDAVLSLAKRDHQGKIFAISRHGLTPAAHRSVSAYPAFGKELLDEEHLSAVFKIFRRHLKNASHDSDWRAVIDSLRPFTQIIWQRLPVPAQSRFLRHLNHFWNVARHRIPSECAQVIEKLQASGALEIRHGRIEEISVQSDGTFVVRYGTDELRVDAVINGTGSQTNFQKLDNPLVQNLLRRGVIKSSAIGIGLDALPTGEIINGSGKVDHRIYTIGTALKGILWESTAIPELRVQAAELAERFLPGTKPAKA